MQPDRTDRIPPYEWGGWLQEIVKKEKHDHCFASTETRLLYENMDEARQGNYQSYSGSEQRGICLGCGWTGPARTDENAAVEDALDHAFPGWRDMPVLTGRPPEDGSHAKQIKRWEEAARKAYPDGWFDRGGPALTHRTPPSTRHVSGRAPGGGYDVARWTAEEEAEYREERRQWEAFWNGERETSPNQDKVAAQPEPPAKVEQIALF